MRKLYCLKHRLTKILGKVGGGTNMQQLGNLSTEQINKRTRKIDLCNTIDILKRINDEDKKVSYAVRKEIHNIATVVDMITDRLKEGGRLFYVGRAQAEGSAFWMHRSVLQPSARLTTWFRESWREVLKPCTRHLKVLKTMKGWAKHVSLKRMSMEGMLLWESRPVDVHLL